MRPRSGTGRTSCSGGCIQCPLGASPHLVIYLFKRGLVTYSLLDTWELGPLDSISYKASDGGLSGTVEGMKFSSQANKLASYSFVEAGGREETPGSDTDGS